MASTRPELSTGSSPISLQQAQKWLVTLWLVGTAPSFLLITARTLSNYNSAAQDVWAWFSPTAIPTLSLVVGGYLAASKTGVGRKRRVDPFAYRLAFGISLTYLCTILAVILLTSNQDVWEALNTFGTANLPLGVLQGFVTAWLGYFFVSSRE
jgi:hypothetical protein